MDAGRKTQDAFWRKTKPDARRNSVNSFTPQAAAELPGPDWLKQHRQRAAAALAEVAVPTAESELWRYSPIEQFNLDDWQPSLAPPAGANGATDPTDREALCEALSELLPGMAGLMVCVDGWLVHTWLSQQSQDAGVRFGAAQELVQFGAGGEGANGADLFRLMAEALSPQPVELFVPAGQAVEGVFVVAHDFSGAPANSSSTATFPWLSVRLEENAQAKIMEFTGLDLASLTAATVSSATSAAPPSDTSAPSNHSTPHFTAPAVNLSVGKSAHLRYLNFQNLPNQTWQIASKQAEVAANGTLLSSTVALGGEYARQHSDTRLVGQGAVGDIAALSFANETQDIDFRVFHSHLAPDTSCQLLFKGAIDDQARSIYTGLIRVGPEASGTNAYQTNRNLKLSDDAWAESVPNLEIENNDVVCSHASTVGPVEPEQMFYLQSRGVPPDVAEKLIVDGFFEEVLRKLSVPEAVPLVRLALHEKLPYEFED